MTVDVANRTIRPPKGLWEIMHPNGTTEDIINTILYADKKATPDTKFFAKSFSPNNLKAIWLFVRRNIRYKADPKRIEKVKSPAATWKDRYSDCKSMSIMIASILKNMGIPYKYRFVAWKPGNVSHVYPIAIMNGREIILDAVHSRFNEEVPFHHGIDYFPTNDGFEMQKISGIPTDINTIIGIALITTIIFIKWK